MSKIIEANFDNLVMLAAEIKRGELVAIPTETVYGLAGDARNEAAVAQIYQVKNRPSFNPLISHYSDFGKAAEDIESNPAAIKLAAKFCPGPLTMILPKSKSCRISLLASAGLSTVAIRVPSHPVATALLELLDFPVVAPSANPSTKLSPVSAEHVSEGLKDKIKWILDGGFSNIGIESTIIDLSTELPQILRYGKISQEDIEAVIGKVLKPNNQDSIHAESSIKAPGQTAKHYAPKTRLRIFNGEPSSSNEALLHFGETPSPQGFAYSRNLSPSANLEEAAANLFRYLHDLDAMNFDSIAVELVPEQGLGLAINDRLRRASES